MNQFSDKCTIVDVGDKRPQDSACSISWGNPHQYYSNSTLEQRKSDKLSSIERTLFNLLQQHDKELYQRITRTYKQWNNILRDYLRNETALRLSIGNNVCSVPVRVQGGLPLPVADILSGQESQIRLVLHKPLIEQTLLGLDFFHENYDEIKLLIAEQSLPVTREEISHSLLFADTLAKKVQADKWIEGILRIHTDILGAYFFKIPEVHLYWMVIGLMASTIGVSVEGLTVVVLVHELAHAYTHLGKDIDGVKWRTDAFAKTESTVIEGLAQFYTWAICKKLQHRFPAAFNAYKKLLEKQSGPYVVHQKWTEKIHAGEIIRFSMIHARTNNTYQFLDFEKLVKSHERRLNS